ncbi:MAG: NUDIX domain-containing protein [Pseudomonadota bacterium]
MRLTAVRGAHFPMIASARGSTAPGSLVSDLSEQDIARLSFYEACFGYALHAVILEDGHETAAFLPEKAQFEPAGPWDLDAWIETEGALSLHAAQEVMSYFGTREPLEVRDMSPMIRARAASALRAAQSRHGRDCFEGTIDVQGRERVYAKFFALDDLKVRHARFDGSMSDVLDRAVFVAADAAFVLPYDPVRDRVLVIEQVRMGLVARGDRTCWHMETIAGRIDAGETPEAAARREALEEAGLEIGAMELIGEVYPTSGCSTEFFYLYLGSADLHDAAAGRGGLASEDEDIRGHLWSFDELMQRALSFDLGNAMLLTSAYYLAHHRARLRSEWASATP